MKKLVARSGRALPMHARERGRLASVVLALLRQRIVANAASLFSTTIVTSGMGFIFWAVAARVASSEQVGAASAALSAMQLVGTLCTFGLGTLLIVKLGDPGLRGRPIVVTCVALSMAAGSVVAVLFAIGYHVSLSHSTELYSTVGGIALFACGVAVTGATIVLDGALVGWLRSSCQLWRNSVYSVVKVLALVGLAYVGQMSVTAIYAAWLIGNVVSIIALMPKSASVRPWLTTLPSRHSLRGLGRLAFGHHWVNVTTQAPRLLLPVMVAAQLGNEANAAFYAALLLIGFVWIVPNHLAVAMVAVVGHEPAAFRRELRTAIRLSAWISVAAFVGTPMIAEWLLLLFGPEYAQAKWCLSAFGAATLAVAVKSIYIAVRRTQSRLRLAAKATGWGAVVEIGGAQLGLMLGGITGLGIGLVLGMVVEAIAMWPVVRAAEPPPSTVALADAVSAAEPTSTEPADSDEPVLRRGGR